MQLQQQQEDEKLKQKAFLAQQREISMQKEAAL
jgi:hypothetical protein